MESNSVHNYMCDNKVGWESDLLIKSMISICNHMRPSTIKD